MRLTQKEVLDVIRNTKSLKSDELARLFILKKGENFVRDILTIEFEKLCEKVRLSFDLNSRYLTAVHDSKFNRHDIVILEATKSSRQLKYQFIPSTIFEFKFHKAGWVLAKQIGAIGVAQDNIWIENMMMSAENIGKEGGILQDLTKMYRTQNKYCNNIAIHHILILSNPHDLIDRKFVGIIDKMYEFNKCLNENGCNHQLVEQNAIQTYREQLEIIQDNMVSKVKLGIEVVTIGKAFGVNLDLIFLVLSEEDNLGYQT